MNPNDPTSWQNVNLVALSPRGREVARRVTISGLMGRCEGSGHTCPQPISSLGVRCHICGQDVGAKKIGQTWVIKSHRGRVS